MATDTVVPHPNRTYNSLSKHFLQNKKDGLLERQKSKREYRQYDRNIKVVQER